MHVIQGILDVQRNTKRKNQILRLLATTMPKIKINYVAIVSRDDMALEIRLTTRWSNNFNIFQTEKKKTELILIIKVLNTKYLEFITFEMKHYSRKNLFLPPLLGDDSSWLVLRFWMIH